MTARDVPPHDRADACRRSYSTVGRLRRPDIAGATPSSAGKAPHISGIAVHGNTLAITLSGPPATSLRGSRCSTSARVPPTAASPARARPSRLQARTTSPRVERPNRPLAEPELHRQSSSPAVRANRLRRADTDTAGGRARRPRKARLPAGGLRQRLAARRPGLTRPALRADERRRPGRQAAVPLRADRRSSTISSSTPRGPCFAMFACAVPSTTPSTDLRSREFYADSERSESSAGGAGFGARWRIPSRPISTGSPPRRSSPA